MPSISRPLFLSLFLSLFFGLLAAASRANEFHVAPDGTPAGDGSPARPWDLATALAAPPAIKPGDTLWLGGGLYRGGFQSQLKGTLEQPIIVRGVAEPRATIDTSPRHETDNGLFFMGGADTIYRDFEIMCSNPKRATTIAGSWPEDIRRGGVDIRGDRISAVNLVVHDLAGGFGFWAEGEGGEISGCLIFNNGWQGPDRAHGHGIYAQNSRGTKRITDNLVFHQFGYGIHVYGSEKASLKGFEIDGNFAIDNGCLSKTGDRSSGIMVGGASPAARITVRDNVVYNNGIRLGYPWGTISEDVIVSGNWLRGGLVLRDFRKARVTSNTVIAESTAMQLEGEAKLLTEGLSWENNNYYVTDGRWGESAVIEHGKGRRLSFVEWQKTLGLDATSHLTRAEPTAQRVIVRPNKYEQGRAHVAIINPALLPEVEVNLKGVLKIGQSYRIVSARNFYGDNVAAGKFDGNPVRVAMRPGHAMQPVGMPDFELPVTEPSFAAFVILPGDPAP